MNFTILGEAGSATSSTHRLFDSGALGSPRPGTRTGPRAVVDLAHGVTVSRPAVSQHLAVLKAAGLVKDRAEGTRRVYEIDPRGLGAIRAWLDGMWDNALHSLESEIERDADK